MNIETQKFARNYLIENLARLSERCTLMFKKMYATDVTDEIEDVVAAMPYDKLDWAMSQVQMSLAIEAEK